MEQLGSVRLKGGMPAEILRLSGPPDDGMADLLELLAHKGGPWIWHLEQWYQGGTPGMGADHYLARRQGRLVGNVTVFRNGALGNVAHVYTAPDSRKLGIARALLAAAIADFERNGGQVLSLYTRFNDFEWRLYESFGFVGICPQDRYGGMVRFFPGADWEGLFRSESTAISTLEWKHFVGTQLLFGAPGPQQIRSIHLPCTGRRFVQAQFVRMKLSQANGANIRAWAAEGPDPCVLGFAAVRQHPMWGKLGRRNVLDLFFHPTASQVSRHLLDTVLQDNRGPLECYCDSGAEHKIALLKESHFKEYRIPSTFHCTGNGKSSDLLVMANEN